MDTMRMKAVLVFVASLAFASAPFWSGEFGGFDPNQYPVPQVEPPAQPAGYAFSIWGLIYLWLLVSSYFGLFRRAEDPDWDAPRWPLFVSLAIGTSWLSVAQTSPIWATVLIWIMLGGAVLAFLRTPGRDRVWLAAPLGLYAGWLTAASAVSLALTGAGYGIGPDQIAWAWIALAVALAIGIWVQTRPGRSPAYAAALAWALVAVALQNMGNNTALMVGAAAGALVAILLAGRALRRG